MVFRCLRCNSECCLQVLIPNAGQLRFLINTVDIKVKLIILRLQGHRVVKVRLRILRIAQIQPGCTNVVIGHYQLCVQSGQFLSRLDAALIVFQAVLTGNPVLQKILDRLRHLVVRAGDCMVKCVQRLLILCLSHQCNPETAPGKNRILARVNRFPEGSFRAAEVRSLIRRVSRIRMLRGYLLLPAAGAQR